MYIQPLSPSSYSRQELQEPFTGGVCVLLAALIKDGLTKDTDVKYRP